MWWERHLEDHYYLSLYKLLGCIFSVGESLCKKLPILLEVQSGRQRIGSHNTTYISDTDPSVPLTITYVQHLKKYSLPTNYNYQLERKKYLLYSKRHVHVRASLCTWNILISVRIWIGNLAMANQNCVRMIAMTVCS